MMRARDGFSLLELSVVIGIISLIASAGISLATGALKAADRVATQERLATIKLALDSYAKTYGYLPCPADRGLLPAADDFGREKRNGGGTDCVPSVGPAAGIVGVPGGVPEAYIGGIPSRTLGLPDSYAGDSWGGKLTYAVTKAHIENGAGYANADGVIWIHYGDRSGGAGSNYTVTSQRKSVAYSAVAPGGVFTVTDSAGMNGRIVHIYSDTLTQPYKGSYTVTAVTPTTATLGGLAFTATDTGKLVWQEPGPGASYVVVSHGPDGRGAFPVKSISVPTTKKCTGGAANESPPPCTDSSQDGLCNDIQNCDNNDLIFYDTAYNDAANPAQYFDDYVVWGSNEGARVAVNPLVYPSCSAGTCENWCGECTSNYPGGTAMNIFLPTVTGPVLCKKVLYSAAATCNAACFWSGTVAGNYSRCP